MASNNSSIAWLSLAIGFLGVVVATIALLLPIWRENRREQELENIHVKVQAVQQMDLPELQFGYLPIKEVSAAPVSLVLHVANLGKAPVFIRNVRLVFREKPPTNAPVAAFYFTLEPKNTDALGTRQSRYYHLPIDKHLLGYAVKGSGPFPSEYHVFHVEVRDHRKVIWSGIPAAFGNDIHEASISESVRQYARRQEVPSDPD